MEPARSVKPNKVKNPRPRAIKHLKIIRLMYEKVVHLPLQQDVFLPYRFLLNAKTPALQRAVRREPCQKMRFNQGRNVGERRVSNSTLEAFLVSPSRT